MVFRHLHRFVILSSKRFALPTSELLRVWCRTKTMYALRRRTGIDLPGEAVPFLGNFAAARGPSIHLVKLNANHRDLGALP